MDDQIVLRQAQNLIPAGAEKDTRYRLGKFQHWLDAQARPWHKPDLAAYRDHLLGRGYSPATVQAHLSTVRGRYHQIIIDGSTRDGLYALARSRAPDANPADWKAMVDEAVTRLRNAIDPHAAPVKVKTSQDKADADQLRLTAEQANALLAAHGVDTVQGLRDTAVIGLMLCTGLREAELSALEVRDLRQRLNGELALHVRHGKGCKERLVPYGELSWVLAIVDRWLEAAGIESGPVFRGLYKGGQRLRPGRLSVRAVQYILADYPIMVDGELATVRAHDCRRTYACRMYDKSMDLVAIQQNLGHADSRTTLGYIGTLDARKRRAKAIYSFDLSRLAKAPARSLAHNQ